MRNLIVVVSISSAISFVTAVPRLAKADRTFLVGGTVIEGKATRKGGKVVIEVETGEVTLPADAVARIEKSESVVSRFEERYRALAAGDAKARLELADYCRDHDMRARERTLLVEVLEIDGQNVQARARLGYVKTDAGWITQADAMRAKGLVQHDGQWVSPSELRELERKQTEVESAARQREEAEAELRARRAQLDAQEAELDAQRSRVAAQAYASYYSPYYAPLYPPSYRAVTFGGVDGCAPGRPCARGIRRTAVAPGPFDSTSLSVVKVPYRNP